MNKQKINKNNKNQGFVAIFLAVLVGFLAVVFTVSASGRVWTHSKSIAEAKNLTLVRFSALSCLEIARLRIFSAEDQVVGVYHGPDGPCSVQSVSENSNQIQIQTSSEMEGAKVKIEATLDSATLGIISISEF